MAAAPCVSGPAESKPVAPAAANELDPPAIVAMGGKVGDLDVGDESEGRLSDDELSPESGPRVVGALGIALGLLTAIGRPSRRKRFDVPAIGSSTFSTRDSAGCAG